MSRTQRRRGKKSNTNCNPIPLSDLRRFVKKAQGKRRINRLFLRVWEPAWSPKGSYFEKGRSGGPCPIFLREKRDKDEKSFKDPV